MYTLEKLMLSIALLLILLAGFCECGEISLKAFLVLSVFDLFLLFKIVQKLDQLQQKRWEQEAQSQSQRDTDDED